MSVKWKSSFSRRPCRSCALVEPNHCGIGLTWFYRESNSSPMYANLLTPLVNKFVGKPKSLFRNAKYTQKTYVHHDARIKTSLIRGVVAVQYTPYDHDGGDDGCTPQARVRMFYENNREHIIDKSWDATSKQVNNKRRRDSCSQFPLTSCFLLPRTRSIR